MDLAIIADDLTGAILIAASIEGEGRPCPVVLGPPEAALDEDFRVVVFATRTRLAPATEAAATVKAILDAIEVGGRSPQIAYKVCSSFDSTDDGNIGPVADLLLDRYGDRPLLMSAGYPKTGTTVHQGYLFYRGRLVSESIKRHDPLTPMTDPDLVRTIARQTKNAVGLVPHGILQNGVDAAAQRLVELDAEGVPLVLLDCSDDVDARIGAGLTLTRRATIGSDAHVMALAAARLKGTEPIVLPPPPHAKGPGAAIFGSVGPVAEAQLAAFQDTCPVLRIDLTSEAPVEAIIAEALAWAELKIGDRPLGVTTAASGEDAVARAQSAFGVLGAARRAETILSGVAAGLVERGVARLAVSGGETSGAVAAALDIATVRCLPDEGFGGGICVAEAPRPLSLYFKSGKLGEDGVMLQALAAMCH